MGTRHLQTVIDKNGVERVKQYGQWDGYPEGQGLDILRFLKAADIEKYAAEVERINAITGEQAKEHDKFVKKLDKQRLGYKEYRDAYREKYYFLSRDCGSDIHQLISDGKVPFVELTSNEEAAKWCEGFYTIDLKNMVFTSEFHGAKTSYPIGELPTKEEYLEAMGSEDEW